MTFRKIREKKSLQSGSRRNIKLVLEYEGTDFHGFQRQDPKPTIQKSLEQALYQLFRKRIKIQSASGRTDSGVHAEGQVVNFLTTSQLPLRNIQFGLNRFLPESIAVICAEEALSTFHARFDAKSKRYEYRIWNHSVRSPLRRNWVCHIPYPLNLAKMRNAAKQLLGPHDFRSFCASDPQRNERLNFIRTIQTIAVSKKGNLITLAIEADGFLYHMVRNIAGTLIDVGRGKMSLGQFKQVLKACDRRQAGMTAPASGLVLARVTY